MNKKVLISMLMIPTMLVVLMIFSGILISLPNLKSKNDSETKNSSSSESAHIDTTISIKDSESATINIKNTGTSIRVQGTGTTIVKSSGKIITIESSGTNTKSTIKIESSSSKSKPRGSTWENPWDDSRWQDNKVPWLEHTQGYP